MTIFEVWVQKTSALVKKRIANSLLSPFAYEVQLQRFKYLGTWRCVLLLLMRLSSCFRGITLVQLRLRASDTLMNYSSEFMYHRRGCFLATVSWQIQGFCFTRHQGLSYKQCVPPGVPNCHPCPIKPHLRPIKHKKQSHKTYNTNTNLKQNHKIHNTNTKLYNTNTELKHNHKIRKLTQNSTTQTQA